MRVVSCGLTDVGLKREGNEDSLLCLDDVGLYAVADGMGGHAAGEVASQTAVAVVSDFVRQALTQAADPGNAGDPGQRQVQILERSVLQANEAICRLSQDNPRYGGMGTTFSGLLVRDGKAAVAHVGDSRIYRLRDGDFSAVTNDHSWVNEQLQRRAITAEEARTHRWRNVITRALGNRLDLEVDTENLTLRPGDVFLLCSDGLSGLVPDTALSQALKAMGESLLDTAHDLVDRAKDAGGDDNITLVILRVQE
jgi:protein phosphatase